MSDGRPRSCKVREACQHPVCPSTCLLPGSLCFWHCVWSGVWTPMVVRCLFQPWLSGLGSSSGAVHCWDAGSAAGPGWASLATAEVLYICLWQEPSGLDKFVISLWFPWSHTIGPCPLWTELPSRTKSHSKVWFAIFLCCNLSVIAY